MICHECKERQRLAREALLRGATGEALTHIAKGAAEMVGVKKKTASKDAKRNTGAAGKTKAVPAKTAQEKSR